MAGPLDGIRIVDTSAILSGPLATMLLADQGAEVVKVEPLGIGDLMRIGGFGRGGLSAFFTNCNRGKRSIALDLAKPAGRQVLLELVRDADVFVQNWRPGAAQRLGLDEPALRALAPGLIYVSVSGFGDSGPYRDRRVYDPIIQGLTGHAAVQVNPDAPIRDLVRTVVADKSTAYTVAQAITAALFARERGAGGQHVVVPMLDASLAFFWPDGMMAHTFEGEHSGGATLYQLYRLWETADGHLIYFAASDAEHHALFRALGHPEWCGDARFGTVPARAVPENREALGGLLLAAIREWPTRELLERMLAEGVPAGPVLELEQILDDPQVRHNGAIRHVDHPTAGRYREAAPAARFDRTPLERGRPAPRHGEHTLELLAELGYDGDRIAALRAEGVIP